MIMTTLVKMRIYVVLAILLLSGCVQSRCKTPWWKKSPNTYYQKEQNQMNTKYKLHKKLERKNHKCENK